ncbi:MAG: M14 family metallopeptidase [Nannocystaceae bacterium]
MSLTPYRDPEAREAAVDELAARLGGELVVYGESVEGRPLRALRVPARRAQAPRIVVGANIHGVEWIGAHVVLELLTRLAAGASEVEPLRDAELWAIPCINPDGYARTASRGGVGPLSQLRANARGVDLNRNFPLPPGAMPSRLPAAGSATPGAPTYRGPHPLSEPETHHLAALLAEIRPRAGLNLHSFMGTVIPASVRDRPSYAAYRRLCATFARAQRATRYRRLASRIFDVFTGEQEDHQHHNLDCWAACVEVFPLLATYRQHLRAPSLFWRFNPRAPDDWADNDIPGIVAFLTAALALPRPSELAQRALSPAT